MEGLIIFIIFMVFSLLRSLGEGQKGQPGQRPGGPQRPMRPGPPVRPLPPASHPESWQQEYDDQPFFAEEPAMAKPRPVVTPTTAAPRQKERIVKENTRPYEEAYEMQPVADEQGRLAIDADSVVLGVIFSEVLGAPRYKKPWRPRF